MKTDNASSVLASTVLCLIVALCGCPFHIAVLFYMVQTLFFLTIRAAAPIAVMPAKTATATEASEVSGVGVSGSVGLLAFLSSSSLQP